jgi:REP element-mobilizing transposase RayT
MTNLLYQVVFSTKNREPLVTGELAGDLYPYISGIVHNKRAILLAIGGMPCHLHLLVKIKPVDAVADFVRVVKSNPSKWINENHRIDGLFAWQTGYGAFTVSESQASAVRKYIGKQREHHRFKPFQEEFVDFLQKNGIEYDDRYVLG